MLVLPVCSFAFLRECVESRDPYCVWNATAYDCQQNTLTAVGELPNTDVPNK